MGLLIGVRSADIGALEDTDLLALSAHHADRETQPEHCLRREWDDGTEGDVAALAACRATIRGHVERALGSSEPPDPYALQPIEVALVFRGRTEIQVSQMAYSIGRALHTLQDSFSHTVRPADGSFVGSVTNIVDLLHSSYDPARDGPPHIVGHDSCEGGDEIPKEARAAVAASAELLAAVAERTGGRTGRLARVDALLARQLHYQSGCSFENEWCGSIPQGCGTTGFRDSAAGHGLLLISLALAALMLRRRGRRLLISVAIGLLLNLPPDVLADNGSRFGIYAGVAGSVTRASMVADVGLRLRLSKRWALQLDLEYNPWLSLTPPHVSTGTINGHVGVSFAWTDFHGLVLRSGAQIGFSTLLDNLVAADAGSTGVFVGLRVLGFTVPLQPRLRLELDPAWLVFTVPQLEGIPLLYEQYRIGIGLTWIP